MQQLRINAEPEAITPTREAERTEQQALFPTAAFADLTYQGKCSQPTLPDTGRNVKCCEVFRRGETWRVVRNTYRPDLNGTTRVIAMAGTGVLVFTLPDGNLGHSTFTRVRLNADGTVLCRFAKGEVLLQREGGTDA